MLSLHFCLCHHSGHELIEQTSLWLWKKAGWQPLSPPVYWEFLQTNSWKPVDKVVINLLQWRYHIWSLSCNCHNHLIKSGTIHNYSLRPIWLLHQPNRPVKWRCGRNNYPFIFQVSDHGINLYNSPEIPYCFEFIILELLHDSSCLYNTHYTG